MKFDRPFGFAVLGLVIAAAAVFGWNSSRSSAEQVADVTPSSEKPINAGDQPERSVAIDAKPLKRVDHQIQTVQYESGPVCDAGCASGGDARVNGLNGANCHCGNPASCGCGLTQQQLTPTCQPPSLQAPGPVKSILGVNEYVCRSLGREPIWNDSQLVPWEMFAYGEYVGPHRTPHVPEYRLRVADQLEFVYYLARRQSANPYQIFIGDVIRISSATDETINQREINVLSDGMISLPLIGQVRAAGKSISDLQDELNRLYKGFLNDPSILVQIVQGDTPLQDIRDAVDARGGVGGQLRQATVSPDGTVQLPVIGSVPAVGLTLDEIRREVNARYRERVSGLEVTPVLVQRAPRFVYVIGQVTTPGRFELVGPTTVLQAIALAEGDLQGANLRNIVVFRRDENWRLTATRLDLAGAIHGKRPFPADELFLRDSDIVLLPRKPITRISEAVDLYLTRTLYSAVPQELIFQDVFQDVFSGGNNAVINNN